MQRLRHLIFFGLLVALLSGCVNEQTRYVRYLHKHMTADDERTYKPEFWQDNVAKALEIRDKTSREYPGRMFRHFVLPVRVSQEPLDRFRLVYADSLCSLVEGMEPEEAVIALNTWCRHQAYFKEGWNKDQSAMGTIEYGYGLCSDLTVMAVNVMRAAGFPAREVETIWSDFRSNHSWLEVYVNGRWAMMSAGEPYPMLDTNAWLNNRRVMCAEIDVFGDYHGPETVLSRDKHITRISNLSKYTYVRDAAVSVFDSLGHPVKGAHVQFLMYHEGGIHPLASVRTDARGRAVAELGYGDVIAFAYKEGLFGMAKVSANQDATTLMLSHSLQNKSVAQFELSPPPKDPDWRYIKSNDDVWAPMDSIKVARLRAHPADEAKVRTYMEEPRRSSLPEFVWPVIGNTHLILHSDDDISWGRELSIFKLGDGSFIPVTQEYVSSGSYLMVTGTPLSEDDKYKVRLETFYITDAMSEIDIPVLMPTI